MFRTKTIAKIQDTLSKKIKGGGFLTGITVLDIVLGEHSPLFGSAKVLPQNTDPDSPVIIEFGIKVFSAFTNLIYNR